LLTKHPPHDKVFREKYESYLLSKLYDLGLVDRGTKLEQILEDSPKDEKALLEKISRERGDREEASKKEKGKKITVSAFCRRRLPVVMVSRLKMAQTVKDATMYVEQGHVRVGTDVVTDPGFLVTR
jgi:U3 small nucleolar ribonucleoprotein protein IMP3